MGGREIKGTDRADHISPDDSDKSLSFLFSLTSRREDQKNIFYGAPGSCQPQLPSVLLAAGQVDEDLDPDLDPAPLIDLTRPVKDMLPCSQAVLGPQDLGRVSCGF